MKFAVSHLCEKDSQAETTSPNKAYQGLGALTALVTAALVSINGTQGKCPGCVRATVTSTCRAQVRERHGRSQPLARHGEGEHKAIAWWLVARSTCGVG